MARSVWPAHRPHTTMQRDHALGRFSRLVEAFLKSWPGERAKMALARRKLREIPSLPAGAIRVEAYGGCLELHGTVASPGLREEVEQAIAEFHPRHKIMNLIEVRGSPATQPSIALAAQMDDQGPGARALRAAVLRARVASLR